MRKMEEKILDEGRLLSDSILDVGSFLNQQIDTAFLKLMAQEVHRLFSDLSVNKVLTIEASGIAIATAVGMEMGVPVVFAKKHKTTNVGCDVYKTTVHSFTHDMDYEVCVGNRYLSEKDTVLIVDDFLARGKALEGLIDIVNQSGGKLAGACVAIEKAFQRGGDSLRAKGIRVEALASIDTMSEDGITFRK